MTRLQTRWMYSPWSVENAALRLLKTCCDSRNCQAAVQLQTVWMCIPGCSFLAEPREQATEPSHSFVMHIILVNFLQTQTDGV